MPPAIPWICGPLTIRDAGGRLGQWHLAETAETASLQRRGTKGGSEMWKRHPKSLMIIGLKMSRFRVVMYICNDMHVSYHANNVLLVPKKPWKPRFLHWTALNDRAPPIAGKTGPTWPASWISLDCFPLDLLAAAMIQDSCDVCDVCVCVCVCVCLSKPRKIFNEFVFNHPIGSCILYLRFAADFLSFLSKDNTIQVPYDFSYPWHSLT